MKKATEQPQLVPAENLATLNARESWVDTGQVWSGFVVQYRSWGPCASLDKKDFQIWWYVEYTPLRILTSSSPRKVLGIECSLGTLGWV